MSAIHQTLRRARRRLFLANLLRDGVWSVLLAAWVALALMAVWALRDRSPIEPGPLFGSALLGLGSLAMLTFRHRLDLSATARRLDFFGQTRDRLSVGLALAGDQVAPLARLAEADCRKFAESFDPRPLLPMRIPRSAWVIPVPVIAAGFLILWYQNGQRIDPATLAARRELAEKAAQLEKLRPEIARAAREDTRLKELAEAAGKAVEKLRQAARSRKADPKEALKQLSRLEAMIDSLQKALAAQSRALENAAALAEAGDTRSAAQALQAAAQNPMSKEERQQLDQALADARAAGQMSERERRQALSRLAGQMRQRSQPSGQKGQGQGSQRQLQSLKNAMQNMKQGSPGRGGQPRPGGNREGESRIVQTDGDAPTSDKPGSGEGEKPGGQPGGERDAGTMESPYGRQAPAKDPAGLATHLNSILDQGESLSDLVPASPGDTSKSTRRYRDLYNAVAADAQNTVDREDIPLASRFFIKRYFENIRPAE